jgi:hypothetical protein
MMPKVNSGSCRVRTPPNARERRLEGALMHDVLTVRGSRKGRSGGTEMDWSELPEELMAKLLEVL